MNAVLKPETPWLRPMSEADLDRVIRIERAAYPYPWSQGNFRDSLNAGYSCWVAELDGEVIGYWVLTTAVGEGHVLNCCISPAWQGRGHGHFLMQQLISAACRHGAEHLYLEVRSGNARAIRLYQGLGFEQIAVRPGYYPADEGREDAVVMRLTL